MSSFPVDPLGHLADESPLSRLAQYRRVLDGRDPELISPRALAASRIAFVAARTHWPLETILALPEAFLLDLIAYWTEEDRQRQREDRMERHLERIGDQLQDIARNPQGELMSYTLQRRLRSALDALLGPDAADAEAPAVSGVETLRRYLERLLTHLDGIAASIARHP